MGRLSRLLIRNKFTDWRCFFVKRKQKITELFFNEHDGTVEVYTHNTDLKKRLSQYAQTYPHLCQLTEEDENGGLRFEIDKTRISIRLTAPYSEERREMASTLAKNSIANLR